MSKYFEYVADLQATIVAKKLGISRLNAFIADYSFEVNKGEYSLKGTQRKHRIQLNGVRGIPRRTNSLTIELRQVFLAPNIPMSVLEESESGGRLSTIRRSVMSTYGQNLFESPGIWDDEVVEAISKAAGIVSPMITWNTIDYTTINGITFEHEDGNSLEQANWLFFICVEIAFAERVSASSRNGLGVSISLKF